MHINHVQGAVPVKFAPMIQEGTRPLIHTRQSTMHANSKQYKIDITDMPAVQFTGQELGFVSSARPGASRWTELRLYKTDAGRIILVVSGASNRPGEISLNRVHTFDAIEDIVEVLQYTRLAKELYDKIGIEVVMPL